MCKDRQKAKAASPDCGDQQADVRAVRGSLQGTGISLGFVLSTVEVAEGKEGGDKLRHAANQRACCAKDTPRQARGSRTFRL